MALALRLVHNELLLLLLLLTSAAAASAGANAVWPSDQQSALEQAAMHMPQCPSLMVAA